MIVWLITIAIVAAISAYIIKNVRTRYAEMPKGSRRTLTAVGGPALVGLSGTVFLWLTGHGFFSSLFLCEIFAFGIFFLLDFFEVGKKKESTEAEEEKTATPKIRAEDVEPGMVIKYGRYPDAGEEDEPIRWLVLKQDEGKLFVVSRDILDCVPFHTGEEDVTWKTCSLRAWLNSSFLPRAFTGEERARILPVELSEAVNRGYGTKDTETVEDTVFILTPAQVRSYLAGEKKLCKPTPYALSRGAVASEDGYAAWWTRAPGGAFEREGAFDWGTCKKRAVTVSAFPNDVSETTYVDAFGGTYPTKPTSEAYLRSEDGIFYLGEPDSAAYIGVRPAMWVDFS